MLEINVFISCGAEVADLRDLAARALKAIERAFFYGLDIELVVRNWDYRNEPPEVIPAGAFAARSLRMVQSSSALIGILGPSIPRVTSQEIRLAIERLAAGDQVDVWLFVKESDLSRRHRTFISKLRRETGMQVIYQTFGGSEDFQEKVFTALIPYVVRKTLLEGAAPGSGLGGVT